MTISKSDIMKTIKFYTDNCMEPKISTYRIYAICENLRRNKLSDGRIEKIEELLNSYIDIKVNYIEIYQKIEEI